MASVENLDLESGGSTSQVNAGLELLWSTRPETKFLNSNLVVSSRSLDKYSQVTEVRIESGEVNVDISSEESRGCFNHTEKTFDNERHMNTNSRNALKPPRPPKGPSLDAADQKMVREIVELARRKRARIEHIKAAKKSKRHICHDIHTTVLLCHNISSSLIGISSTTVPNLNTHGSPEPAVAITGDLSFLHYSQSTIPRSTFQNSVTDQVSRFDPPNEKVLKM